jgi:uncharacterized protein (DUF952 family)
MVVTESIYRLITLADWQRAQASGQIETTASDLASGFMHLSPRREVLASADAYFQIEQAPLALRFDPERFGADLKWEIVTHRGGVRFPHLYAEHIPSSAVLDTEELSVNAMGEFQFKKDG